MEEKTKNDCEEKNKDNKTKDKKNEEESEEENEENFEDSEDEINPITDLMLEETNNIFANKDDSFNNDESDDFSKENNQHRLLKNSELKDGNFIKKK